MSCGCTTDGSGPAVLEMASGSWTEGSCPTPRSGRNSSSSPLLRTGSAARQGFGGTAAVKDRNAPLQRLNSNTRSGELATLFEIAVYCRALILAKPLHRGFRLRFGSLTETERSWTHMSGHTAREQ